MKAIGDRLHDATHQAIFSGPFPSTPITESLVLTPIDRTLFAFTEVALPLTNGRGCTMLGVHFSPHLLYADKTSPRSRPFSVRL